MPYTCSNYSDAVSHAANLVLTDRGVHRAQRTERLLDLLHSLAQTIPESWGTKSRALLACRERSIERIIHALSLDVAEHPELSEYFVLSSVLLLAFTIKQLGATDPNG
jgi:hypothetical protein